MNKDAYYFPHDSNAKDDPKCVLLIEQLGMEGYGIYWMLVETLRDQPDYTYPVALLPALARRYNTTPEKVKTVVYNYGLFTVKEDAIFFSQSLNNRMQILNERRNKLSEAGRRGNATRWNIATRSQGDSDAITTQSQVNKSKVKESKKEDITNSAKASLVDRQTDFQNSLIPFVNSYGKDLVREFFNYWSEPNQPKTKMRFELEKTWETERRLQNWQRRKNIPNGTRPISKTIVPTDTSGYHSTI